MITPANPQIVALSKQPRLFRVWVYEICHGSTPFMNRMLMLESCAGITQANSWEELGRLLDQGISVDGQTVCRVECITPMRSTGVFYNEIGAAHVRSEPHPSYFLPAESIPLKS